MNNKILNMVSDISINNKIIGQVIFDLIFSLEQKKTKLL